MRFIKNQNKFKRNFIASAPYLVSESINTENKKTDLITKQNKLYSLKEKIIDIYKKADKRVVSAVCAVFSAAALITIFNMNFSFAYNAYMGSTELGYVPNKAYIDNCMDSINAEFSQYVSGEDIVGGEVIYVPSVIRKGNFTDDFTLEENIKSTSDVMVKAYAVEVNGMAFAALDDEESAKNILQEIALSYKTEEDSQVSFKEDVAVIYEYVPASILLDPYVAKLRLQGERTTFDYVVVDRRITSEEFARANGIEVEYLKELNPLLGDMIEPDCEVIVADTSRVLTVLTSETVTYDKEIPFDEKVTEDSDMYEGAEKLVRYGENGVEEVTEKIERENGDVVTRKIVKTEIKTEPVMQLRSVGTKTRPANMGTGSFIRPYGGTISSRFGSRRSGNHTGVDFCGNTGDPIVAADSGTVVLSEWSNGYGKLVKIDHNNGYVTYYAHCSELYVSDGDVVQKGDVIAALGSTGNSTGPHVHFEIRYEGDYHDPLNYVR